MNLSKAISALKMSLGLYGIALPFKDENNNTIPTEKVLSDVISTVTIPIYSEFVPWIREYDEHKSKLTVVDKKKGIYMIPEFLTMTPIKYVLKVELPTYRVDSYGGIYPSVYGSDRSAQAVINSQAQLMLHGEMRNEPTFKYLGENKIQLLGYPDSYITFKVGAEHMDSGETIKESCYDSFMELATLDVKMFLYNNLKLYDGMPTAFGQINFKIEEYQSADSDRTSLLNEWRDRYHLDLDFEQFM